MISWEYLAGFVDGEGCIKIYTKPSGYKVVRCTIGQKHREVLDQIQTFLMTNNAITLSRGCYYLQLNSRIDVEHFLLGILPYLIVKKQDALAVLELYALRDPERQGV